MDRFKGGNPVVGYDDSGRILSNGSPDLRDPRYVSPPSADPYRDRSSVSGWRRFFTRGRSDPEPAFDRRYEWQGSRRSYEGSEEVIVEKRKRDGYVVEDRLVYDEKPRFWWLFIVLGLLLAVLGVLNLLFCLDLHLYSRFFAAVALFVTGVLGLLHSGNLRTRGWKAYSIIYIIIGVITMALVFFCLGMIIDTFIHESIDIGLMGRKEFIEITQIRIDINHEKVRVNISNWETHIWLCYGMDGLSILLCLVGFLVLTSVIIVFDNYYNNNYTYIRQVEPFCEPMLWNPYGQMSLGQVMILFGFVISDTVFGNDNIHWHEILALVWAGILPVISGWVSAIAYKRTYSKDWCWAVLAIILQIINILASLAALALLTYGMYENIITIEQNTTTTTTNFSVQMMTVSVIMFAIGDCLALANIFWGLAILIRLISRACCGSSKKYTQEESLEYRDGELFPEKSSRSREVVTTQYPADVPRGYISDRAYTRY